jgi:hypothetical protein
MGWAEPGVPCCRLTVELELELEVAYYIIIESHGQGSLLHKPGWWIKSVIAALSCQDGNRNVDDVRRDNQSHAFRRSMN